MTKNQKSKQDTGVVRVAKLSDISAILQHRKQCLSYLQGYKNILEDDDKSGYLIVYELDNKIIGSARLDVKGSEGRVTRVVTSSEYRNSGVGSALISNIIKKANTIGLNSLKLRCLVDNCSFYEKLGFIKNGPSYTDKDNQYYNMKLSDTIIKGKGSII